MRSVIFPVVSEKSQAYAKKRLIIENEKGDSRCAHCSLLQSSSPWRRSDLEGVSGIINRR
jgi:hypothetical protein